MSDRSSVKRLFLDMKAAKIIFVLVTFLFWIFLAINTPLNIWHVAGHDDGLFMRQAMSLTRNKWLGSFSQFTLMKGPGYPVFLALSAETGLPISLAHGMFQFFAVGITAYAVGRVAGREVWGWVTFALLVFLPAFLHPEVQRVIRDQIYWGQTLIVFSTLLLAFLTPTLSTERRILAGLASGLVLAWAWLTREEGIWFLPGIFLLISGALLANYTCRKPQKPVILSTIALTTGFAVVHIAFMTMNFVAYGSFANVDFNERQFKSALHALQSVKEGERIDYVPMNVASRESAAKVSPAFAPLAEMMKPNGPLTAWSNAGCRAHPETCGDIAGSLFVWALRDAAALSGHYESPSASRALYRQIALEINAACQSGELTCEEGIFDYIPPMSPSQWASLPGRAWRAIKLISLQNHPATGRPEPDSSSATGEYDKYWSFLNYPKAIGPPKPNVLELEGWLHLPGQSWPRLRIGDAGGEDSAAIVERIESQDIARHVGDPAADQNRFRIMTVCSIDCVLTTDSSDGELRVPLSVGGPHFDILGKNQLVVDTVREPHHPTFLSDQSQEYAQDIKAFLFKSYSYLYPMIIAIGMICLALALLKNLQQRTISHALVAAVAAYVLVATRIMVQVIVDASAFPAINMLYSLPAIYLTGVASVLAIASLSKE